ncbi:MAG: ZrgA family zinc uptake protein [Marinobacter sp.]
MPLTTVFRLALLAAPALAVSAPAAGHEQGHQQAHVHGVAQLQLAIEGNTVELILRSPAANLVGFEHAPKNREQEQALAETREWLRSTALIQGAGGDCTVVASSVDHEHGKTDAHDHHGHDKNETDGHSEFEISQRLDCDGPLEGSLETPLLERFGNIETLSVEWVGVDGQGHTELHTGESRIRLER